MATGVNIKTNKMDDSFKLVYGYEVSKSKTVKIKEALTELDTKLTDCIFITDTPGDIREGKETGIKSIGVTWGFHERERLERGNPYAIVDKLEEIILKVKEYFSE